MTVRVPAGGPHLTISHGDTFMVTSHDGAIAENSPQGVFAGDTRFVSGYGLRVNGQSWNLVSAVPVSFHHARIYLANPDLPEMEAVSHVPAGTIGLTIDREIAGGVHEQFEIVNYALQPVLLLVEIEVQSDFADLFEVRAGRVEPRESVETAWEQRWVRLTTTYRNEDFLRRFTYQVRHAGPPPSYANGRLHIPVALPPRGVWRACGHMALQAGDTVRRAPAVCRQTKHLPARVDRPLQRWQEACPTLQSPDDDLNRAYRQSIEDMAALRLSDVEGDADAWFPAAGIPWYVALFGRDSLIASLQTMIIYPRFAEGTLRALARSQATNRDDWRDAQPGKIVHEVRHGELAHFNLVPHARYYGTWDATSLFVVLLGEAWRWLGDRRLVEDLIPAAERCLQWIDTDGDLDGDGFQEYQTFSPQGYENMGWKDAHDAVVYPDGSQVAQPKALCELQGYVYAAKSGMADVYDALGRHDRASALRDQAADLKRRFNDAFWMEAEGFYAFGLDREKRPIRTIASNAGHCLWSGIADPDKAARVCERLMQPDMWSGWGIRTLSAEHPAYNPLSYQRGSIWPHDTAIIAAGLKRYGFVSAANQIARGMFDAAARFAGDRLPEVFAGFQRAPDSFPVPYRDANVPQAWAAGAVFQLIQTMLGLRVDLPNETIVLDPTLPDGLPQLDLAGLQFGRARLDIAVWREGTDCHVEVTSRRGVRVNVRVEQERFQTE